MEADLVVLAWPSSVCAALIYRVIVIVLIAISE